MAFSSRNSTISALLGAALTLSGAGIGTASADVTSKLCGSLTALSLLDGSALCTHGNDDQLLPMDTTEVPLPSTTSTAIEVVQTLPAPTAPITTVAAPVVDALQTAIDPAASVELDSLVGGTILSPAPAALDDVQTQAAPSGTQANAVDGAVPTLPATCIGNGTDGHRVEVLALDIAGSKLAAASDVDIRRWAGQVTWTYMATAQRDGAERIVRWVTSPTDNGCEVKVTRVRLSAADVDGFQNTITALAELGYNASNRKYLTFANVSNGICGIGTVPLDDRAGDVNAANLTAGYSRIDAPCWGTGDAGFYSVAAHELTHNLGGVQSSAPNSSGGYHCTDQWDLMCYADGSADVSYVCEDANGETGGEGDHNNRLLDCNGDDYFNAAANVTGYLDTNWNVADSLFLDGRPAAPAPPEDDTEEPVQNDPREDNASSITDTGNRVVNILVDWFVDLVERLSGTALLQG